MRGRHLPAHGLWGESLEGVEGDNAGTVFLVGRRAGTWSAVEELAVDRTWAPVFGEERGCE